MKRLVFIHFRYLYSAPSRFLLRGAPDYSADTESEFHAEAHEQLQVKDLPRVPTRRLEVDSNPQPSGCKAPNIPLEVDSNPQPSGCKAPNIPLHHCAPQIHTHTPHTYIHTGADLEGAEPAYAPPKPAANVLKLNSPKTNITAIWE